MNKTVEQLLISFIKWIIVSLLTVSGLANLGFWFFIGKALWYHQSHYLWISLWWLLATIPNSIVRVYAKRNKKMIVW